MRVREWSTEAVRGLRTAPVPLVVISSVTSVTVPTFFIDKFPDIARIPASILALMAIYEAIQVARSQFRKRAWLEHIFEQDKFSEDHIRIFYGQQWCDRQIAIVASEPFGKIFQQKVRSALQERKGRRFNYIPHL